MFATTKANPVRTVFALCNTGNLDGIQFMNNPWSELPRSAPFVLPSDADVVDQHRLHFRESPNLRLQTQLIPEPFNGSPTAAVCVLALNPGFSENDTHWHDNPELRNALIANLTHDNSDHPFVYLNPKFCDSPGSKWWASKLKHLVAHFGAQSLSNLLLNVELFPYHSKKIRRLPASISSNRLVPSSEYSAHLVRGFISSEKPIVILRSRRQWFHLVPELQVYGKLWMVRNPRNPALSPNNLDNYDQLVASLENAK